MKFLIIDDHPMLREGVAAVLRQLAGHVEVLQASDGVQGVALAAEHADLTAVFVDLRMAGLGGIATVTQLHAGNPALPIMVMSSSEEPADVRSAMAAGARGYCPKSAGQATILAAIRLVLSDELYLPPFMLFADESGGGLAGGSGGPSSAASAGAALSESQLTARQLDVLRQVCEGHPNKVIARQLGMQEKTVKGHVTAIFRVLGVVNRVQAVEAARKAGLLS